MKKIVVIGSSNVDTTMHVANFPKAGETINAEEITSAGGGKGANQAIACAKAGAQTVFISRVGEDSAGEFMIRQLKNNGVDTTFVQTTPQTNTGHAYITLDQTGQNDIIIDHGANYQLSATDITAAAEMLSDTECVLAQFETPLSATLEAFRSGKGHGAVTILNPAPAIKEIPAELIQLTDIVTPNESESAAITGIPVKNLASLKQNATYLRQLGFKNVVITYGDQGAYLATDNLAELIPAVKTNAVDTTGAGDTFIGYLAASLQPDLRNFKEAAMTATQAAAIAVSRLGAQPSIPIKKEVIDAMENDHGNK
jgi:ribokinase